MKDNSSSAADNSTVSEEIKEAVQYLASQTNLQNMYKEVVLSYREENYDDAVSICKNLITWLLIMRYTIIPLVLHYIK